MTVWRSRMLLTLAVGLLAAAPLVVPPVAPAVAPAAGGVTVGVVAPVAAASRAASPTVTASRRTRANGKIRVQVQSTAKVVQVEYRTRANHKRMRTKRTKHHRAAFVLPAGARSVYVRARSARRLPGRGWKPVPAASTSVPGPTRKPTTPVTSVTAAELAKVADRRVFFGHQSVGANLLGAVPGVYARARVAAPAIIDGLPPAGGGIGNSYVGQNFDPGSKIDDFVAWIRTRGVGTHAQVAFMKLCYVDVTAGRDVDDWFAEYRSTMQKLQNDYPRVTFLHVTAPLTTDAPGDNLARKRLNTLLRAQYGSSGRLFDLAAVESTRPDGTRVTGQLNGQTYESMYPGYTQDGGHLNATGAARAAAAMLHTIAGVS